jgi:hypothetical protein
VKIVAFRRTIDSFIIGYAKQTLSIFLVDLDLTMDVVNTLTVTDSSSRAVVCMFHLELVS